MIKEFVIELEEHDQPIVVSWSELGQYYVVSFPEPLPLHKMHSVLCEIKRVVNYED